jgi:hypothetical protein
VNDLTSQCAAHYLANFVTNSEEFIRDVLKRGRRGAGGLVEEVEYWLQQCQADVSEPDNNLGYWDIEEMGPWVYAKLRAANVARVVSFHTRGWSYEDFASYGYTISDKAELDAAIAALE